MTRRLFWRALATFGFTSVAAHAHAQQPRLDDRTLGGGSEGIARTGNIFQFTTAAGNPAPTRLGIYRDGDPEPVSPAEDGAAWILLTGPADNTRVLLKVNVAGNALVVGFAGYRLSEPSVGDN
jgi:hypothetical protein